MYDDLPIFRDGTYYVRVLADSLSPQGVRLTTLECRYPRWLHSEVLRHRVDSHSVESNRAVPTEIQIDKVRTDPFVPATFNKRVKGMGVGEAFDEKTAEHARATWVFAAADAAKRASKLNDLGLDKSRANRLLEPFLWVKDIITATEWTNFLALRCPPGNEVDLDFPSQLEFQEFALLVRMALQVSRPKLLQEGWWHLPGATRDELAMLCDLRTRGQEQDYLNDLKRACPRRLAKVSFDKTSVPEPIHISINKYGELVNAGHYSPTEHIATPMTTRMIDHGNVAPLDKFMIPASEVKRVLLEHGASEFPSHLDVSKIWCGNFRGWVQNRKEILGEEDHAKLLDYKVL